jgi:phytoene dehydrogenase-like protein
MADATFDAVIIGGGNKTLVTAIYLAKYGKMKVGVFEERHELGGGWSTHEAPAPGFSGNSHASTLEDWFFLPLQRDFPDIEEKGLKLLNQKCGLGIILKEDQSCLPFYHISQDPTGELAAKEIARLAGEKDAETWWRMHEVSRPNGGLWNAFMADVFDLPSSDGQPGHFERWFLEEMKRPGSMVNRRLLALPANYAVKELWEHPGMQYACLRRIKAAGMPTEAAGGPSLFILPFFLIYVALLQGGTHSAAHACARILLENGGRFFTKSKVDRILVENGMAKGIRLADGTEVAAKLVVSGVDPYQLCFDLIGPSYLNPVVMKKIANLERSLSCITWYTWALHEAPDYKAADYNPDINNTHWVILGSRNVEDLIQESYWRRVGRLPPNLEVVNFHHHTRVDRTQAPEDKHTVGSEIHTVDATRMTERQWMEYKQRHAEETMATWREYMRNMSWDQVIGYDAITPYDIATRQRNMAPYGNLTVIDRFPGQSLPFVPIQEWSDHRIRPIENLYGTGSGWGLYDGAHVGQGYTCYKAIAQDLGLAQPWEGQPW